MKRRRKHKVVVDVRGCDEYRETVDRLRKVTEQRDHLLRLVQRTKAGVLADAREITALVRDIEEEG